MTNLILTALLQQLIDFDTHISMGVNALHAPFWDSFMLLFSGRLVWVAFYVSLAYLILRNNSWRVTLFWLIVVAIIITLCDQLSSTIIRPMVGRLRPCDPENPLSETVHIVNGYHPISYGFPSAHAANTWGLAFFVIFLFRNRWLSLITVLWAILTCYSRMYLGAHYLGDLLSGLIVGAVCATLIYFPLQHFCRIPRPSPLRHVFVPITVFLLTVVVLLAVSAYHAFVS